MHNYCFSQIITTLVPVGKARETKVSYVEINCRRRRKILHIFGPSVLLAWRNHQQFPRSFSIRSGTERKKLAAYFFLRGQQFFGQPPPPPLGTQVPSFGDVAVRVPRIPNFRPCRAEIPIFWPSCGAYWFLTHVNRGCTWCSTVGNAGKTRKYLNPRLSMSIKSRL